MATARTAEPIVPAPIAKDVERIITNASKTVIASLATATRLDLAACNVTARESVNASPELRERNVIVAQPISSILTRSAAPRASVAPKDPSTMNQIAIRSAEPASARKTSRGNDAESQYFSVVTA